MQNTNIHDGLAFIYFCIIDLEHSGCTYFHFIRQRFTDPEGLVGF